MSKKESSSKSKKVKKEKKKRKNIFGTALAVIIAIALLSASGYAVYYLVQRGQRVMDDYSGGSTTATEATQPVAGHSLEQKQNTSWLSYQMYPSLFHVNRCLASSYMHVLSTYHSRFQEY